MPYGDIQIKGVWCDNQECTRKEPWDRDETPGKESAPPHWMILVAMGGGSNEYFCPTCSEKMLHHVSR